MNNADGGSAGASSVMNIRNIIGSSTDRTGADGARRGARNTALKPVMMRHLAKIGLFQRRKKFWGSARKIAAFTGGIALKKIENFQRANAGGD